MATEKEVFKFPDEIEEKDEKLDIQIEEDDEKVDIEVVDDTPEEDRNVEPLPEEIKDELEEADEADEFSKNVKTKFKQYKKAWHDERREKEAALKEQQEALAVAQRILDENKRLKSMLVTGEQELIVNYQNAAELELEKANRKYKEAYDLGDSDKIIEANNEIMKASLKLDRAKNFKPTANTPLQEPEIPVKSNYTQNPPQMDSKTAEWISKNPWYTDPKKKSMSKFALGVHEELEASYGKAFVATDEYFKRIDQEVKRRFPEEFAEEISNESEKPQQKSKPSTVVAPAKRSTSSKKIVLSKTQVALAKKLGLTPEQYASAQLKLES
jgi:hypothetical protein